MNKTEIEAFVEAKITSAAHQALNQAMIELQERGHSFSPSTEGEYLWVEQGSDEVFFINYTLSAKFGPSFSAQTEPAVTAFLQRAKSGIDIEAQKLNLLEGGVANGGFSLLYSNKGLRFFKDCSKVLEKISATKALEIVEQVHQLLEQNQDLIKKHRQLERTLAKLDTKFLSLKESIAELFERYRRVTPLTKFMRE